MTAKKCPHPLIQGIRMKMNQVRQKKGYAELISAHRAELMGLSAFLVLFFHVWVPLFRSVPVLRQGEGFFKRIIYFSVDIFFLLSGMGLPQALEKSGLVEFYYHRIRRITFPFLCVALLSWPIKEWGAREFLYAITGLGFWTETIYYFLWFIPAIFILYSLFPLYYRFLSTSNHPIHFTAGALCIWFFFSIFGRKLIQEDAYGFINRIPIFLIGVMLGNLSRREISISFSLYPCYAFLDLGLYLAYRTNYTDLYLLVPESNCFLPSLLISLSLCPLFASLMEKSQPNNIIRRFLVFLGGISLELYCVQEWLASLIREPIIGRVPPVFANLVIISTIITAGYGMAQLNRLFVKRLDHAVLR